MKNIWKYILIGLGTVILEYFYLYFILGLTVWEIWLELLLVLVSSLLLKWLSAQGQSFQKLTPLRTSERISSLLPIHRVNLPRTFTTKYPPHTQRHTEQEI